MFNKYRRDFIKSSLLSTLAFAILGTFFKPLESLAEKSKSAPLPEGQSPIAESDAVASAIGYRHNVKDIDYARYPQRKKPETKGQFCKSCALYTSVNEGWGKCQMLTHGLVSAEGWCGSYSKKV